jgi:hypothetical protein
VAVAVLGEVELDGSEAVIGFKPADFGLADAAKFLERDARRKTRTKRRKPVNPWHALPRLADLFDHDAPQPFFKGSKVPELEELALTETQLLEQTAALLGVSLGQLVKAGTLVYAKREFLKPQEILRCRRGRL